MRSRRPAHDDISAIARRRLELITAELGRLPAPAAGEPALLGDPVTGADAEVAAGVPAPEGARPEEYAEARPPWEVPPLRGKHARRPLSASGRATGWVHDRLPPTLQGRVRLSAAHLTVVALLVACALAVTAWWVVRADGSGTAVPAASWSDTAATDGASPEPLVTPVADPSTAATASDATAVVVVDVEGKVRRPGIVTLPIGSRVVDALEKAGGARPAVDLTELNLARVLVDGEQIVVGIKPPSGIAAPAASGAGAAPGGPVSMVNINSATQADLEELPGVGPVTAAAILQWRTDNGPFTSVDELLEVSGIGDATLAKIAPFVTLWPRRLRRVPSLLRRTCAPSCSGSWPGSVGWAASCFHGGSCRWS